MAHRGKGVLCGLGCGICDMGFAMGDEGKVQRAKGRAQGAEGALPEWFLMRPCSSLINPTIALMGSLEIPSMESLELPLTVSSLPRILWKRPQGPACWSSFSHF